eukprot:TRINITY_DN61522_c0_g1_i1.p1 TRINITY_DN61522_c0_g1~~TRINITY_DN61522_c0_g1_i1.p1  ORF type:complete len:319 (+),score=-3.90 TRINITY_DN61522_c0_g1_i1:79-957(+)
MGPRMLSSRRGFHHKRRTEFVLLAFTSWSILLAGPAPVFGGGGGGGGGSTGTPTSPNAPGVSNSGSSSHSAPVFLQHVSLYRTHDPWGWTPTVYFKCAGEEKRLLTGVVAPFVRYNFSLLESFQPLTELTPPHCKSCGLYEADTWTGDDTFDQWELCPLAFSPPGQWTSTGGLLSREVRGEFNATFVCPACNSDGKSPLGATLGDDGSLKLSPLLIALAVIGALACVAGVAAFIGLWVKKGAFPLTLPVFLRRHVHSDTAKLIEMFEEEDGLMEEAAEVKIGVNAPHAGATH